MPPFDPPRSDAIRIRGARQNNLKNLDLDLPLNELIVVTGVSGSGKSSLVFDTLYAEGQRRYVETFSPYARQFLDRMDKPQVDRIEGIPPAIAIDQTNPVRTSRSTVGTMTELNDHLKLLFARAAVLHCRGCGRPVRRDTPASIQESLDALSRKSGDPVLLLTFPVPIPKNFTEAEIQGLLSAQGYTRIHEKRDDTLQVIQDRFRWSTVERARAGDAIEAALKVGQGRLDVYPAQPGGFAAPWRFSTALHCPDCDISYKDPSPSTFSFNSPIGACDTCRGFGRSIGVDYGLVIPDAGLSLRQGAIKPWQTESYKECQTDLLKFARKRGIPVDTAWRDLTDAERTWVIEGEGEWTKKVWYGVRRFFAWLETKAYKMHIRVLLSRYRSYTECGACRGARLKPEALLWRIGDPGINIRELMLLSIDDSRRFFAALQLPAPLDEAADLLLREIRSRLRYLTDVGLGYLNLDRQSRTLSGGEVQRINLTTALGTSLVNTLFVLDEPSIGLHARDVERIVGVMHRLRDAGNTLVVVEHDPKVMQAADRVLDIGPGPGEHGGEIVFFGPMAQLASREELADRRLSVQPQARRDARRGGRKNRAQRVTQQLEGATEHNLKNIDVDIPLERLVCVTGVSGSGKSTLVHDMLYPALLRAKGKPTENPGAHRALEGRELIDEVVMVDQSRIGRTTRSNPASYVGAFDAIRDLFAKLPRGARAQIHRRHVQLQCRQRPLSRAAAATASSTSRCSSCRMCICAARTAMAGAIARRSSRCGCRAASAPAKSIADVLDLTVSEALAIFCRRCRGLPAPGTARRSRPRLPAPGPAGADAVRRRGAAPQARRPSGRQRRARQVAAQRHARSAHRTAGRGSLFLFDEPTTGLHFDDVAKLLRAFRRLIDAGHSLLVIEHNLDVIRAADWIIDLGPEGGDAGGAIVCAGTPADVMRSRRLAHRTRAARSGEPVAVLVRCGVRRWRSGRYACAARPDAIEIHGAREHNLKNIDVDLGRNQFTVITGVSGSGKSTLAFDILFAEGQRRYLESLNAYARQFVQPASRPDVDAIFGIPPTVAIEQRTSRGGRKSTVATLTEIYHFLRLLYVKLGRAVLPGLRARASSRNPPTPSRRGCSRTTAARASRCSRRSSWRARACTPRSPNGRAARASRELRVDGKLLPTAKWPRLDRFIEHNIELPVASADGQRRARSRTARGAATSRCEHGRGVVHVRCRRQTPSVGGGVLDQARLPQLRHRLSRTRSAPVLLQFASTAGARAASAPACNSTSSTPNRAARNRSGARRFRCAAGGLPGLRRRAAQSGGAATCCSAANRSPRSRICRCRSSAAQLAKIQARGPRARHRPRLARGARRAHRVSLRRGPGLSAAQSGGAHAVGRRSAAHPPGGAAGFESAGRVLRAGRAHHRAASARQRRAARYPGSAARQGQYAGGGRARRGHHPPRRSRDRFGARRRHARRPGGRAGHAPLELAQLGDSATGRCLAAPLHAFALAPPHGRSRHASISRSRARPCTICARSMRAFRSAD